VSPTTFGLGHPLVRNLQSVYRTPQVRRMIQISRDLPLVDCGQHPAQRHDSVGQLGTADPILGHLGTVHTRYSRAPRSTCTAVAPAWFELQHGKHFFDAVVMPAEGTPGYPQLNELTSVVSRY
jgi:hypothetical protein